MVKCLITLKIQHLNSNNTIYLLYTCARAHAPEGSRKLVLLGVEVL